MIRWLMKRGVGSFERQWNYDGELPARHDRARNPRAAWLLLASDPYESDAPTRHTPTIDAWSAAAIVAVRQGEDCGPCTQLGVAMAERAGVGPQGAARRAHGEPRRDAAGCGAGVAVRTADAHAQSGRRSGVERRNRQAMGREREAVVRNPSVRHGRRAVYPTVKYTMGHGKACTRVVVGGAPVTFDRAVASGASRMIPQTNDPSGTFEPYRRRLRGLAYRMLGFDGRGRGRRPGNISALACRRGRSSISDPEVVPDDDGDPDMPRRAPLPAGRGARTYVGPWLPDPVGDTDGRLAPDAQTELTEDTVALMLALDRLSPLERAAFPAARRVRLFLLRHHPRARPQRGCMPATRRARPRARANHRARPRDIVQRRRDRRQPETCRAHPRIRERHAVRRPVPSDGPPDPRCAHRQRRRRQSAGSPQDHRGRQSCLAVPRRHRAEGMDRRHRRAVRTRQRPARPDSRTPGQCDPDRCVSRSKAI